MYEVKFSSKFKKDMRLIAKRGYDISNITEIVKLLAAGVPLHEKHRDHELKGNWLGHRACHVSSDWILIYKVHKEVLVLTLTRTGTHSDILGI